MRHSSYRALLVFVFALLLCSIAIPAVNALTTQEVEIDEDGDGNTDRIETWIDDDDDGSLSLSEIITMIGALLASMGLLTSVAIIGLPIFIVGILFLLVAAFVGSKKTNYFPANKSGGRK